MSHFNAYPAMSRSDRGPRKIGNFENPKEFLMAIHDAIDSHRGYYCSRGEIHGNINAETVYIGSPSPVSNKRGGLMESATVQPLFQSANILARTVIRRKMTLPIDYLDDLESFYYIIAYFSMASISPGRRLPVEQFPDMLSKWAANPESKYSALEKEEMLRGHGFSSRFDASLFENKDLSPDIIFEALVGCIHSVLKRQYDDKWSKWQGTFYQGNRYPPNKVYDEILGYLRSAVFALA